MRRLRRNETLRSMVRETRLAREDLILPLFVVEGTGRREAIASMPGVHRFSVDQVVLEAKRVAAALGYIGLSNLDRVCIVPFSGQLDGRLPPARGKAQIFKIFDFLQSLDPGDQTSLGDAFRTFVGLGFGERPSYQSLQANVKRIRSQTWEAVHRILISFAADEKIERGDGVLVFTIEDGGVVETASKTMPILLQTVDLTICPEGGDLVAGLPCRVYIEARTPFQKPADIAGVVLNTAGTQVGTFRTEHEGRGRFVLDALKDEKYTLKISEPAADLAVAAALISALQDYALPADSVVFGEISLSGALRPISQPESRLKEAEKLGFSSAYAPSRMKTIAKTGIDVHKVGDLSEFIENCFGQLDD